MSGGWRRIPGRVTAASAVAAAGWCVFAVYLVIQARLGPPLVWNDSAVYAAVARRSLWSRALWAGPRPPLLPLVLKVVGGATALVTTQALVAAVAWGALAWTVGRLTAPGWRRVAATFLVLGFATTMPVAMWNRSELSESLSMSLLALVFAGFIWVARRPTWPRVAATAVACLGFALTRDAQVWTVGILALVAGAYAVGVVVTHRGGALRAGVLALSLLAVAVPLRVGNPLLAPDHPGHGRRPLRAGVPLPRPGGVVRHPRHAPGRPHRPPGRPTRAPRPARPRWSTSRPMTRPSGPSSGGSGPTATTPTCSGW